MPSASSDSLRVGRFATFVLDARSLRLTNAALL